MFVAAATAIVNNIIDTSYHIGILFTEPVYLAIHGPYVPAFQP